jgi:pimeloyl-ACP methyl ester carboxylesterase
VEQLKVKIAGQQIAYLESPRARGGQDDPAVIFVHGNSSSARTWLPILSGDFGQRFRCLALDLPGHGQSEPARDQANYSVPGYAAVLTGFAREVGACDAVIVGWSLGGQIAMEAAPALPDAGGFVIFGAPPIATPAQLAEAFVPHPAIGILFKADVSEAEAKLAAESLTAPGSPLDVGAFAADILATDGAARAGLAASAGAGRFADEIAIVTALRRPLAILQGADEQLVSLDYLRKLHIPALWRGEVLLIPGTGHAPHQEAPAQFAALLTEFIEALGR